MGKYARTARVAIPIAAVVLGICGGSALAASRNQGSASTSAPAVEALRPGHKAPVYPKNAQGKTMGKGTQAATPAELPDLIAAQLPDGRQGYVLRTDIDDTPSFSSPQEAIKWSQGDHTRKINVYLSDGKTVIGQLTVGG